MNRPYVLLSCAMSIDGYIDDATADRLLLSDAADLDRIDAIRAEYDAILVGAGTIRADNPSLLVRSPARRDDRTALGRPPDPVRVILSASGDLDPGARIFSDGRAGPIVYAGSSAVATARQRLGTAAEIVDAGQPADLTCVLADLAARGIGSVIVEGGTSVHTQFLTARLADELRLAIAPFFVGDSLAPRLVGDGSFPWNWRHHARLARVTRSGDLAVLRYVLSDRRPPPRPGPG